MESVVKALWAHSHWLDEKKIKLVDQFERHDAPSPLDEAKMIADLYFSPDLVSEILDVSSAHLPVLKAIYDQLGATTKAPSDGSDPNEAYLKARGDFTRALFTATDKCRTLLQNGVPITARQHKSYRAMKQQHQSSIAKNS